MFHLAKLGLNLIPNPFQHKALDILIPIHIYFLRNCFFLHLNFFLFITLINLTYYLNFQVSIFFSVPTTNSYCLAWRHCQVFQSFKVTSKF